MKEYLELELSKKIGNSENYTFNYLEDNNLDVINNTWLENRTSYIYKVAVMTAIDSNKCDFAHVVIVTQRSINAKPELKGYLYFREGENDDMGAVIQRAFELLKCMHPAFEP